MSFVLVLGSSIVVLHREIVNRQSWRMRLSPALDPDEVRSRS